MLHKGLLFSRAQELLKDRRERELKEGQKQDWEVSTKSAGRSIKTWYIAIWPNRSSDIPRLSQSRTILDVKNLVPLRSPCTKDMVRAEKKSEAGILRECD